MPSTKTGLYASFNEGKNGRFERAIKRSWEFGCFTWFDKSDLDPAKLTCPTAIFIRITGTERYYRGVLLAVRRAPEDGQKEFLDGERNHCLAGFTDPYKTVLYIHGLSKVKAAELPSEILNSAEPQRPAYKELEWNW